MSAIGRRLVTIPRLCLLAVVFVVGAPVWTAVAIAIDAVRLARGLRGSALRLFAFGVFYVFAELVGLTVLGASWVRHGGNAARLLGPTYAIQAGWAGALFGAMRRLFDVSFEVTGRERLVPGPTIVLVRHASLVDVLLPTVLLAWPERIQLRFVLKRELLALPCLDVAGHRVPNAFVARDGVDTERELARVRALGEGLGPRDGILIYPEGTRFTPAKRDKALVRLQESAPDRAARLSGLRHLLPIRPGGVLATLDAAPDADVVIVTHNGLEGLAEVGDILRGGLAGRRGLIRVERFARAEIPATPEERLAWLDARWLEADAWLAER